MSDQNAKIDNNYKKTLLGVTDDASAEIRRILVDPTTGRLKCSAILTASFLSLSDTPSAYTGQSGKVVAVKATEDGLEFVSAGSIDGSGTASEIAYWVDSNTLGTLAVATYPNLTELSYVKGVTSALQTQLGGKAATLSGTQNEIAYFNTTTTIASLAVATYPSLTELSYVKGLSSALQTQLNGKQASMGADDNYVTDAEKTSIASIVTTAGTQTLTNKRITQRVVTTTDDATAVIDVDTCDIYQLSAVANNTEFTLSGTPTDGQKLIVRIKDAGAGKTLTWTGFTAIGVTLPTTTVASKWHIIGCIYNSVASSWQAVAVIQEA